MAHDSDKLYQAAQIYAARNILSTLRKEVVTLQEAEFFLDVDTMRDIVDPQGAAACIHYLLGQEIPKELTMDLNVLGLTDEIERMQAVPAAKLAVKTLFCDRRFRQLLQEAIGELQKEFGETAGDTPEVLQKFFDGAVNIS